MDKALKNSFFSNKKLKAIVFIILFAYSFPLPAQDYLRLLNDTVPNITFTTLSGKTYNTRELKGKTIVMNFWYTHCAPCVAELPYFDTLEKRYINKDVVFLYLSKDTEIATKQLLVKKNLALDAVANTEDTHTLFEIKFYPTTVVVDKYGIIKKNCSGINCVEQFLKSKD